MERPLKYLIKKMNLPTERSNPFFVTRIAPTGSEHWGGGFIIMMEKTLPIIHIKAVFVEIISRASPKISPGIYGSPAWIMELDFIIPATKTSIDTEKKT